MALAPGVVDGVVHSPSYHGTFSFCTSNGPTVSWCSVPSPGKAAGEHVLSLPQDPNETPKPCRATTAQPQYLAALQGGCQQGDSQCHSSGTGHSRKGSLHCASWEERTELMGRGLKVPNLHLKTHMVPCQQVPPARQVSATPEMSPRGHQARPQFICTWRELGPLVSSPHCLRRSGVQTTVGWLGAPGASPCPVTGPTAPMGAGIGVPMPGLSSPGRGLAVEAGPVTVSPARAPCRQQTVHVDLPRHQPHVTSTSFSGTPLCSHQPL